MGAEVLQIFCKAYAHVSQEAALVASAPTSKQLALVQCKVTNDTAGAIDMGILRGLGNVNWNIGQVASNVLTDVTAAVQGGTATNIFDTTNSDGFMVSSPYQFGLIGLNITTGESGSPVYTYKYWNGSAWTTLPVKTSLSTYATGKRVSVAFLPPTDWVPGGSTVSGTPASSYNILIQASTAPGQAVAVSGAWVGVFIDFAPQVAQYGSLSWPQVAPIKGGQRLLFTSGDYLLPYFSTAGAGNQVSGIYLIDY